MEQWVLGKWGNGILVNIPLENVVKSMHKKINSLEKPFQLKMGFSTFHYSIIPLFHV